MSPTVEDCENEEEKENMTLLKEEFFVVDSLEKEGRHEAKNQEVESQPRKQKIPLPSSQTMTGQTIKNWINPTRIFMQLY